MKTKKLTYSFKTTPYARNEAQGYSWIIITAQGKTLVKGWSKGRQDVIEHTLKKAIFRLNKLAGYNGKPWNETSRELKQHMKKDPLLQGSDKRVNTGLDDLIGK